ncbi:uncharacterized protein E0L32_004184 [Thyridium curvatum]|uniref:Uncharacterized protein n=1 Tax=Thyridium curvatum TaxID=1093900 RepID=A0A507BFW2_9PEZI|nr:uncharacterized protein E0L32_004184 [Thyridium curvatum]TPX16189.1 hypothetical protein E0L32_004184 [Thyridium curvatum]
MLHPAGTQPRGAVPQAHRRPDVRTAGRINFEPPRQRTAAPRAQEALDLVIEAHVRLQDTILVDGGALQPLHVFRRRRSASTTRPLYERGHELPTTAASSPTRPRTPRKRLRGYRCPFQDQPRGLSPSETQAVTFALCAPYGHSPRFNKVYKEDLKDILGPGSRAWSFPKWEYPSVCERLSALPRQGRCDACPQTPSVSKAAGFPGLPSVARNYVSPLTEADIDEVCLRASNGGDPTVVAARIDEDDQGNLVQVKFDKLNTVTQWFIKQSRVLEANKHGWAPLVQDKPPHPSKPTNPPSFNQGNNLGPGTSPVISATPEASTQKTDEKKSIVFKIAGLDTRLGINMNTPVGRSQARSHPCWPNRSLRVDYHALEGVSDGARPKRALVYAGTTR